MKLSDLSRLPDRTVLIRDAARLAGTLALAGAGAALFEIAGLPAPWIAGAMIAVAVAALAGAPVYVPRWLREGGFFLLGLNIGAAVTPESLAGVVTWPASLLLMTAGLPLVAIGSALPLIRWRGWQRDDALLATVPGALTLILALADATDADVPRIAMIQAVRVAIIVAAVPLLLTAVSAEPLALALPERATSGPVDFLVLVASGLALAAVLRRARFPAAGLLGAVGASAALHATGAVSSFMPTGVLVCLFVLLGAGIGARFAGLGWRGFRAGILDSVMTFAVGFALSLGLAVLATLWLGIPFGQTLLAFSPGGLEVMVVMAFLLGFDAAYVGAHHVLRLVVLLLVSPVAFRRRPVPSSSSGPPGS